MLDVSLLDVSLLHEMGTWVSGTSDFLHWNHWGQMNDLLQSQPFDLAINTQIKQTDLGGDVQKAFNHFVKTGQIWAFIIGVLLGYIFRSFTSYG